MKDVLVQLNRARPLLILAGVTVAALLVSLSWEGATSYDDGGIGSAAFLIIGAISIPGKFLGLGFLGGALAFIALCVFLDIKLARLTPISRTSWWNFTRAMAQAAIIMAAVFYSKYHDERDLGPGVALLVLWISMAAFLGFRWSALREDLAKGAYSEADFLADPRTKLIGPTRPAVMWFIATVLAMLSVVILDVLRQQA